MYKLVILDRDGVINIDSPHYIKSPEEWNPINGSIPAIAKLTAYGFKVAVVTNQSGVGRGLFSLETLHNIHKKMLKTVEEHKGFIEKIFYCPHAPTEDCICRKPKPGLLHEAIKHFSIQNSSDAYYVGDSFKDLEAALAAKCTPILVLTGNGKQTLEKNKEFIEKNNIGVFEDLAKFVTSIG